jgi:ABC-type amino acid transport substrate-binding protein
MHRTLVWVTGAGLVAAGAFASDMPDMKARGTLKVIAQKSEAPEMFRFSDAGEPGFEREMIEGFARIHEIEMEAVAVETSAERIPALLRGEGDVIIGIVDTESRREQIAFTEEVLPARHLVVTWKPHRVIEALEEFRREKIGVVKGTSWAQAAVEAGVPLGETALFPDREDVYAALEDGRITATVMTTTDFLLATRFHPELQGGVAVGAAARAGWGVRKEDKELLAALNEYIFNFRAGPSWSRLVVKYFGDQALRALGRER